ncbi:MAG: hypothetical protein UX21_C0033G0002 [Microgenomates group bacterium GW2011_GWC2_45_8]|uniref:Uncharacterized protein n=1 Tax=Candidatus Nomurabacteria bacterium GW2011_GWB1_40_7 TaxID=1618744 RepID=A0A0G0SZS3_9BACT|nr:MAG: hypothetical protein UU13_C0008G0009 [Candidatus Nomurabacteria bacterium GW2011_GWB1_40_7]KKU13904.1 MAG: hypothetical protein UX21_C0033G0002 [Microgenomates group bacterium GW2011_GWC2_45_8]
MIKVRILLILGIWVAVLPYLGFPSSWKDILYTLSGLVLVYFSYVLYKNSKTKGGVKKTFDNFKESNIFNENHTENPAAEAHENINYKN